eukprot:GEMP01003150.1.p1 GENE.GEMP01003150.1~~GEMP01003150.1.p1  ORF type:complete len:1314 (+),score=309.07 GEMP01003150.1:185-4126(+)
MPRGAGLAIGAFVCLCVADVYCKTPTIPWYYGVSIIAPFVILAAICSSPVARQCPTWLSNVLSTDVAGSLYFAILISAGSFYAWLLKDTWVHPFILVVFLCMYCNSNRSAVANWCFIAATTVSCALLADSVGVARLVLTFSVAHLAPPQGPAFSVLNKNSSRDVSYSPKDGTVSYFRLERRTALGFGLLFFGIFLCLAGETIVSYLTHSSQDWSGPEYRTVTISILAMVVGLAEIILLLRSRNMHLLAPALATTASCIASAYDDRNLYVLALYSAHASESFELLALALWDLCFFALVNVRQLDLLVAKPEVWPQVVETNVACLCVISVGLELARQKRKCNDATSKVHALVDLHACNDAMISINSASSIIFGQADMPSVPIALIPNGNTFDKDEMSCRVNAPILSPSSKSGRAHRASSPLQERSPSRISRSGGISIIPSHDVEPWSHTLATNDDGEDHSMKHNNGGYSGITVGVGSVNVKLPVPERRRVRAHSIAHVQATPVVNILSADGTTDVNSPCAHLTRADSSSPVDERPTAVFDRRPRARSICVEVIHQEAHKNNPTHDSSSTMRGGISAALLGPMSGGAMRALTPIQPDDLHEALAWNQMRKGSIFGAPIGIDRFKELQQWSARNSPHVASVAASIQASRVASVVASARASCLGSPHESGGATPKDDEVKMRQFTNVPRSEQEEKKVEEEDGPTRASSAPTNDNWSRRSSVSVIEMGRYPQTVGPGGSVPQQPGHVNTSLASSNKSSAACSINASLNASVHQSRRSSAFHQKRGLRRGDTTDTLHNFVGEGTIVGLDVMPEEEGTDSDDDNSFGDLESQGSPRNPNWTQPAINKDNRSKLDEPASPNSATTISVYMPEEDVEILHADHRNEQRESPISVLGERRESGLDLNQLLSSCPNLSVRDMADKNSELGNMSLMELLTSIQKSAVFPVGMDMAPGVPGYPVDMDMAPIAPGNAAMHSDYVTSVLRRPSVDTAQMQRNLYGLLPSRRKCNCTGNVHTCMSPMSSAGASLAHSPHWGRSEMPSVAHSQLASIVQSERASVTCSPILSDEEEEDAMLTERIVEKRRSLQTSRSFDLEKRAKKYNQKLKPKVKVPASPIPEGDEDDSRRPSFSQEPSCTEEGQPAVVSPTSNFARFRQVNHEECAALIRDTKTLVLDVRGRDFCGGNIPGSRNMRTRALQEEPRILFELLTDLEVDHVIFTCMYSVLRAISCAVALQQFVQAEISTTQTNPPKISISILKEGFHGWLNYWNDLNRLEEMVENYDEQSWVACDSDKGGMVHVMDALWSDKGHALLFNALQEIAADNERW